MGSCPVSGDRLFLFTIRIRAISWQLVPRTPLICTFRLHWHVVTSFANGSLLIVELTLSFETNQRLPRKFILYYTGKSWSRMGHLEERNGFVSNGYQPS